MPESHIFFPPGERAMEKKDLKVRKEGGGGQERADRLGRGLQSPRASLQMTNRAAVNGGREGEEKENEDRRAPFLKVGRTGKPSTPSLTFKGKKKNPTSQDLHTGKG